MKNRYFICSDIHNDYKALQDALSKNNFNINNEKDILIVAGDVSDRGEDAVKVHEFLYDLCQKGKAIVTQGNHTEFIISFLENKEPNLTFFNFRRNGLAATIDDFLHQTRSWETYIVTKYSEEQQKKMSGQEWNEAWMDFMTKSSTEINEEYPWLLPWLKSLPDYVELENSIITHGMIDCKGVDWHNPMNGWKSLHWATPHEAAHFYNNTGKHVYVGHIDADTIRAEFGLDAQNEEIYTRPGDDVTYLDSCTIITHRLNMVVVEDTFVQTNQN